MTSDLDRLCHLVAGLSGDVDELVRTHVGRVAPLVHGAARQALIDRAVARLRGFDSLDALMADAEVTEILVNRGTEVWFERRGSLHRGTDLAESTIAVILERILAPLGRRLDRSHPIVDARLPDGSRLCAVVDPIAVDGTTVSIRRVRRHALGLDDFLPEIGDPTGDDRQSVIDLLTRLVTERRNIIISGATSSGKSSLMTTLIELVHRIDTHERIVMIEDTAELAPAIGHLVRLEGRPPTPDGPPPVDLERLVHTALRLRPDRLIVGEVRGSEVVALLHALNTGHSGSMSTCHANSAVDALARLESLVVRAAPTWPLAAVRDQIARGIDAVVHVSRTGSARRTISDVIGVTPDGYETIYHRRPAGDGDGHRDGDE